MKGSGLQGIVMEKVNICNVMLELNYSKGKFFCSSSEIIVGKWKYGKLGGYGKIIYLILLKTFIFKESNF